MSAAENSKSNFASGPTEVISFGRWGVTLASISTGVRVGLMVSRSFTKPRLLLLASLFAFSQGLYSQNLAQETAAHRQFLEKLSDAAIERTHHAVRYDPSYVKIPYPGGDVPADTGVRTDEVIRSYRALGIDLQKEVHEDMEQDFSAYPRK